MGTLKRNLEMMKIIERVLVPGGWNGERRQLESGKREWEFKISKESWKEDAKKPDAV